MLTDHCGVQVLCTSAPSCCQLQEKEVWTQQPGRIIFLGYYLYELLNVIHLLLFSLHGLYFCIAVEAQEEDQVDCSDRWRDLFGVMDYWRMHFDN